MIKEIKEFELYSYQNDCYNFILENIDESDILAAAAPNAGKTIITSFVVRHLVSKGKRILCSVHGTNTLKRQFYKSICKIVGIENVSIYDTSDLSLYDPEKPVQIMIYQNIKQMQECVDLHGKFDYLIVDEAHKFYDGTDSMDIIAKKYVSGNHLLLTGSPAIFKEKINSGEIRAIYISASLIDSVHSGQYDKDIRLDVVSNDVHLTIDDYNQDGEVISESQNKLTNNDVILESLLVGDFGKTIIYVKRTKQADEIQTYLNNRSIINFISHSKTDKDSSNIDNFKKNYSGVDDVVLIVVGRATEGYDDPNISIIDLTYTKNIDTLYQRYSRGIRKRTDAKYKRYVKVVPNNDNSAEVFIHIMTAVLMLLKQEHYENFNGKNFSIPIIKQIVKPSKSKGGASRTFLPKKKHETNNINDNNIIIKSSDNPFSVEDLVKSDNFNVSVKVDDKTYEITENNYNDWVDKLKGSDYVVSIEKSNDKVDDCLLMETKLYSGSFFDTKNELYGLITRYATSSLKDVLREISSDYLSPEEHFNICVLNKIYTRESYLKFYNLSNNNKLRSKPYIGFCDNEKDFYQKIRHELKIKGQYEYDVYSIEECVELGIKHNIKSGDNWSKKYKNIEEIESIKLPISPWNTFNLEGGVIEFSRFLGNTNGVYGVTSIEECVILALKNNIKSGINWTEKYKEIEKIENIKLPSTPWSVFNLDGGISEFSKLLGSNKYEYDVTSIEECISFGKKYGVKNSKEWSKDGKYKEIGSIENIKLPANPWSVFNLDGGGKEFSKLLGFDNREYEDSKTHFDLFISNKIIKHEDWLKFIKKSSLKLLTQPWYQINETQNDWFSKVKEKLNLQKLSYEDHFRICIENKLTSLNIYYEYKKSNYTLNMVSQPWKINNMSQSEFFTKVRSIIGDKYLPYEDQFNICVNNEITSSTKLRLFIKKNPDMGLKIQPWNGVNKSEAEYFKEVRDIINERIKIEREYRPAYLGEFSEINKNWNTSNSNTTHQKLLKDKSEWVKYHELYSKARQNWDEIPYIEISKIIKDRPDWIVGDFGCGENLLSKEIENKIYSFDHVSVDDNVISCDLTNVPLDNNSLDVVVFSLSLMGTNYIEYLKEAYRVLKPMAQIFISEPSKRWEDRENELKDKLINIGFTIIGDVKYSDRFIYINGIKN